MNIYYEELLIIVYTALEKLKKEYALYEQDLDKNLIELCKDIIDFIYKTSAKYYKIDEDNPF